MVYIPREYYFFLRCKANHHRQFIQPHNASIPSRFSDVNETTYRPTNDYCTMRSIYSPNYCYACLEGMWLALLTPLSFIDNVTQTTLPDGSTQASLDLLPLAQFREIPIPHQEAYTILWYGADRNVVLEEWTNQTTAQFAPRVREFGVEVRFSSDQIRVDEDGILIQRERYVVT